MGAGGLAWRARDNIHGGVMGTGFQGCFLPSSQAVCHGHSAGDPIASEMGMSEFHQSPAAPGHLLLVFFFP